MPDLQLAIRHPFLTVVNPRVGGEDAFARGVLVR
jgi:hypothetical protein